MGNTKGEGLECRLSCFRCSINSYITYNLNLQTYPKNLFVMKFSDSGQTQQE